MALNLAVCINIKLSTTGKKHIGKHIVKTHGNFNRYHMDFVLLRGSHRFFTFEEDCRNLPRKVAKSLQLSNEKNLGWLGNIGDYTTQLYRAL